MKTLAQLVGPVLTETLGQQTREPRPPTPDLGTDWFTWDDCGDCGLRGVRDAVLQFAQEIGFWHKPRWLTLVGGSGNGKTFAVRQIWRRWFDHATWGYGALKFYRCPVTGANLGRSGQFVRWKKFVDECRGGDFSRREDIIGDDFVVLDDIGAESDSALAKDVLFRVLDGRVGKWTLITSNLLLEQIAERIDVRVASRLIRDRNVVVENRAPDYALRKFTNQTKTQTLAR